MGVVGAAIWSEDSRCAAKQVEAARRRGLMDVPQPAVRPGFRRYEVVLARRVVAAIGLRAPA
jgi:hypothetical protein